MDWATAILVPIVSSLMTFFGIWIKESFETKRQKNQLNADKDNGYIVAMNSCKANHKADLDKIKDDYSQEFDLIHNKLDELSASISSLVSENQMVTMRIDNLTDECRKHNQVIERTFKLEERCSVLENREKVSENRLSDLERHEEQKQIK